jgi:uroporphyrinogen decarboxylase
MLKEAPEEMHRLLGKLSRTVAAYLNAQIGAGAQVLQIFDTWGGILPPADFEEFSLRYIREIVAALPTDRVPVIVFCKDCGHAIERIAETGCQAVGLDAAVDIGKARAAVGAKAALQGNLDPAVLRSEPAAILSAAGRILESYGAGPGHVFNLGHGITPDIPVDHVKELVRFVQQESQRYHTP